MVRRNVREKGTRSHDVRSYEELSGQQPVDLLEFDTVETRPKTRAWYESLV